MAIFNLPDEDKAFFREIAKSNDETFARLLDAIAKSTPSLDLSKFAERVKLSTDDFTLAQCIAAVHTLVPLTASTFTYNSDIDVLASNMRETLQSLHYDDITSNDLTRFEGRIKELVASKTLCTIAKAGRSIGDLPRILLSSSIVTDVRPVYSTTAFEKPTGATIISTLKVQYQENDNVKAFHVALDSADLVYLKDSIDRALREIRGARTLLENAKVPYLTNKED